MSALPAIADARPAMTGEVAATAGTTGARRLRLAYLTTEYPKVSHTFIRREILELERRGHAIVRLAIRGNRGAIADPADRAEQQRTVVCMHQPKAAFARSVAWTAATRPRRWLRAMRLMWQMSRLSDRGLARHAAYLAEAALLLRILRRERIEHLHVHFGTNAAAVARLARCLGGPPYSFTVHGPDEFDAPRGFSLAEKIMDASFVVAISDYCAAQLRRWAAPQQWSKIHIVRCTVGQEFLHPAAPPDPRSRMLLCVARLSAQKGQLVLLDAMRRVLDAGVEAELVLAGDGEMRELLEQAIERLGLRDRVRITGWVDEPTVRQLMAQARALVQPSFAEGLPVVMMEALAMGRPVIASAVAGIPELVHHGENGWLIAPGNVQELVRAMREALQAPAERLERMGQAGRRLVRERHFTPTQVDRLEQLILAQADGLGGDPCAA